MRLISLVPFFATFISVSCLSRAPTAYELDRRAGRTPVTPSPDALSMTLQSQSEKPPKGPVLAPPEVLPVWIYGHAQADGTWLQGTWVFVEASPARWTRRTQ